MDNKLVFDKHLISGLTKIKSFLEQYIEDLPPVDEFEGEPTDYNLLSDALKDLDKVINSKPYKDSECENDNYVCVKKQSLTNLITMKEKFARESIKPLFRYCVVSTDLDEMALTDDIGDAMLWGANASRNGKRYNVCRVEEDGDKTWILIIEGYCEDGHYDDALRKDWDYLHYDFVRQKTGNNVTKIR